MDERLASTAARPIIRPQTIVMDHGKQYTSRAFEHACRHFGINVQPAHPDTPTDKPHVERTLQSVSTLFAQYLPGYLGRSVERRGQKAEQQAVLSLPGLQDVLEQWIVAAWQNRPHEGDCCTESNARGGLRSGAWPVHPDEYVAGCRK